MHGLITEAKGVAADARASLRKTDALIGSVNGLALKLDQRVDTLTHALASVEEVGVTARALGEETMPRMNALIDDVSKETRTLGRVVNTLGDNPQSLVFGAPPGRPGPGERFRWGTIMLRAAAVFTCLARRLFHRTAIARRHGLLISAWLPRTRRPSRACARSRCRRGERAGWMDNSGIYYRLAYQDAARPQPYAQSRWVMPPRLIGQRLRGHRPCEQGGGIHAGRRRARRLHLAPGTG